MWNYVSLYAALVLTLSVSLSGCATVDRLTKFPDGPQVYGGTRTHLYPGQRLFNTLYEDRDSKLFFFRKSFLATVWAIDLFCSFAADTVCLPITSPAEHIQAARRKNSRRSFQLLSQRTDLEGPSTMRRPRDPRQRK